MGDLGKIEHQHAGNPADPVKDAADRRRRAEEERAADPIDNDIAVRQCRRVIGRAPSVVVGLVFGDVAPAV
jgi:hypothetical protein